MTFTIMFTVGKDNNVKSRKSTIIMSDLQ